MEIPECHARGNKAPSKHFRPECRLDQCGSKCTLSVSQEKKIEIERKKENRKKEGKQRLSGFSIPRALLELEANENPS